MIRTALALLLVLSGAASTGPEDWPACQPDLGIVTECYTPQGDWETIGRADDPGPMPTPAPPADPASGSPTYTG